MNSGGSMKNKVSLGILLLIASLLLSGCENKTPETTQVDDGMNKTKLWYAWSMFFETTVGLSSSTIFGAYEDEEAGYTDVVFVSTQEEKEDYADNTIVCWPSADTEDVVDNLNGTIESKEIDVIPYSLEYPITVSDLVYRWEAIRELFSTFSHGTRRSILKTRDAPW